MNDQPKKNQKSTGVKKNAGLYADAVTAEERDAELRDPGKRKKPVTEELKDGGRVSDGRRETYTGNTASELNKPA